VLITWALIKWVGLIFKFLKAFQTNRPERNSTAFVLFENNYSEEEIEISLIHIISFICFLLILSNFLILSFWLGERKKQLLIKNKMFVFREYPRRSTF